MTHAEYVRTDNALFSKIGQEFVALNIERGHCYGLNDTASAVWEMLDKPRSLTTICAAVEARYDVDPTRCQAEIEQLLGDMVDEGLVNKSVIGVDDD